MARRRYGLAVVCAAVVLLAAKPDNQPASSAKDADDGSGTSTSSGGQVADVPADYLRYYRAHADTCNQLDWALLAGIGKVETNHGRSDLPGVRSGENHAGAGGPMQFLAPTFAEVRSRHSDVGPDRYDPNTAIKAAAHYLCDSGLNSGNEYRAIFTYNRADWYVRQVQDQANQYRQAAKK